MKDENGRNISKPLYRVNTPLPTHGILVRSADGL